MYFFAVDKFVTSCEAAFHDILSPPLQEWERKGGGNPVVSSSGTTYFNDMLGTTVGSKTQGRKYSAAALTAFGEDLT